MADQSPDKPPEGAAEASGNVAQEPAPAEVPTPEEILNAEKVALNIQRQNNKLNLQSAPIRQYLEGTVVPTLMQGLQASDSRLPAPMP
eukprot:gene17889-24281_t